MTVVRLAGAARFARIANWLTWAPDLEPQTRDALISTLIQRRPAVFISCVAIMMMSASAAWLVAAPWALAWFGLDLVLVAYRLFLSFRHDRGGDDPIEGRGAVVGSMFLVFMVFGLGCALSIAIGPPVLMLMGLISVMGVFSGLVSRWAAFPRLALLTIAILSALIACAISQRAGGGLALAAIQFVVVAATTGAQTLQNHRTLVRMVQAEHRNWLMARSDPLTGLHNRVSLLEKLGRACAALDAAPDDPALHFAILYIDLDGFKAINDTHGHEAGDRHLEGVGRRLERAIRRTDSAYRIGGDEFVVVAPGAGAADSGQLARRIIAGLAAPQPVAPGLFRRIGASVGIAIAAQRGCDPMILLAEADSALYEAKRSGKSCFQLNGGAEVPLLRAV
ncbi:MAG: hypothetical protein JWP15_988 [Alphaproteobacteria bacterium]|nr:hypothetical protein [Alphaproteobacteria bacterium]